MSMIINSGAVNGTQSYGQTSGYLYFPSTGQSTAAFVLGQITSGLTFPEQPLTFNVEGANAYTLVAYGDPTTGDTSVQYPNILLLTDNAAPVPSGQSLIRVANVSPAVGVVDYSFDDGTPASVIYGHSSDYIAVPAGQTTINATNASTGASLFTTPQTFKASAGSAYTVLVSEPTVASTAQAANSGTVTYGTIILTDR